MSAAPHASTAVPMHTVSLQCQRPTCLKPARVRAHCMLILTTLPVGVEVPEYVSKAQLSVSQ
jgi:hypothetical protein